MAYFIGVFGLLLGLIGIGAAQGALAVGTMYLMHKKIPDRLPETRYGDFDFDSYNKLSLQRFLLIVAIVFIGPTVAIHLLEYLIVYKHIVRHWTLVLSILFVFEVAAIGYGLYRAFRLDPFRLAVLTTGAALAYLFFQRMLVWTNLLI